MFYQIRNNCHFIIHDRTIDLVLKLALILSVGSKYVKFHFDALLCQCFVKLLGWCLLAHYGPSSMTLFANEYQGGQVFEVFSPQVAAWLLVGFPTPSCCRDNYFERRPG